MENSLINKLDRLVPAFIFAVILALILSMIVGFVKGFLNIGQRFLDSREPPTEQIFHGVAVTLIFVKSYKILTAYFLHDHISLKFLVEITIISWTVEVLFNTKNLEFQVLVLLALFGTINLVIYLLFEEKLESLEHHRNC